MCRTTPCAATTRVDAIATDFIEGTWPCCKVLTDCTRTPFWDASLCTLDQLIIEVERTKRTLVIIGLLVGCNPSFVISSWCSKYVASWDNDTSGRIGNITLQAETRLQVTNLSCHAKAEESLIELLPPKVATRMSHKHKEKIGQRSLWPRPHRRKEEHGETI